MSELSDILEAELKEVKDPVDRFKKYIYTYTEFLRRKSKTAHLVTQAIFFDDADLIYLAEEFWSKHYALVESTLREGIESGVFKPIDTRLLTVNIRGMILWYFMSSLITEKLPGMEDHRNKYDDKLAGEIIETLLYGIMKEK